jgi:DNA-3-methyladenine glycosylase
MRISFKKLPRSFYLRSTVTVAKSLLGKYLVRKLGKKRLIGKIVEAEAYCEGDPASHSYRGKTQRNEVMFEQGGHLYVYFTYGMHFCANVVTREKGVGEAVLIRAVEPVEGMEVMRRKRGFTADEKDEGMLSNGPARVCQAFGITRKHNGVDLCGSKIWMAEDSRPISPPASGLSRRRLPASLYSRRQARLSPASQDVGGQAGAGRISHPRIVSSSRIGIRNGRDKQWRFYLKGNRWVSKIKSLR